MTHVMEGLPYRSAVLTIPWFGVQVRAVCLGQTVYFPVKAVCMALGIDDRSQRARLQEDSRFADPIVRDLPVDTSQGIRDTVCIRKDMLGTWLDHVEPGKCKLVKTRQKLEEFQKALSVAADRFLFGDTQGDSAGVVLGSLITGILHLGPCPECGANLCLVIDGGQVHLQSEGTPDN